VRRRVVVEAADAGRGRFPVRRTFRLMPQALERAVFEVASPADDDDAGADVVGDPFQLQGDVRPAGSV
jgi:hypothetical protein